MLIKLRAINKWNRAIQLAEIETNQTWLNLTTNNISIMNRKRINFNQEKQTKGKTLPTNWRHKLKDESNRLNQTETWINRKYLNQKLWARIELN